MSEHVLVVDDDRKLRDLLKEYMRGYGYEVSTLPDGSAVLPTVQRDEPAMVILDIMMPGKDGLEVLRELRAVSQVPVIMLTAKGDDADRIVGLELGADDYMPKPFNPRELLARIKAVLRRYGPFSEGPEPDDPGMLQAAGLTLDRARRLLLVADHRVRVSTTEYKIIEALMGRPDTVFTRDQLMNIARGREAGAFDRSIDVHVSNLRAKLKPHTQGRELIKTVWGAGYTLVGSP